MVLEVSNQLLCEMTGINQVEWNDATQVEGTADQSVTESDG